ncbi:MAG: hypothetical protein IPF54_25935 [Draconibacterium sp.]|nr:hypothetical protein [Draconibacterium sp.]
MFKPNFLLAAILLLIFLSAFSQKPNPMRQWNMYRGNYANGILDNANLPKTWNVETGENLAWKTAIPGSGHSCPIVWGEKVFVTSAVSSQDKGDIQTGIYGSIEPVPDSSIHTWKVYCIDKKQVKLIGRKLHTREFQNKKGIQCHRMPTVLQPLMANLLLHFLVPKDCIVTI